jgi:1-acyl-sn-glycerol-3-phosphate acyltransferase
LARPVILSKSPMSRSPFFGYSRRVPRLHRFHTLTNEEAHRLAREKGVSRPLYALIRGIVAPTFRTYFRMHIEGADHIPAEGPAIVAPNHKSFWDSFFIAVCTRRHVRYMGKSELFKGLHGRLLVRLGAFPVRRGQSDQDALETARTILRQDGLLALFPEGTRIRDPEGLGEPKRGAGRLALETSAPIVPCAITGTDHLFAGPLPKPKRVQVAFAEPIPVSELPPTPEGAGELIESKVWPEVESEFGRLRARPGLIAAGLAAAGLGAGLAVRARRRRARAASPARRALARLGRGRRG